MVRSLLVLIVLGCHALHDGEATLSACDQEIVEKIEKIWDNEDPNGVTKEAEKTDPLILKGSTAVSWIPVGTRCVTITSVKKDEKEGKATVTIVPKEGEAKTFEVKFAVANNTGMEQSVNIDGKTFEVYPVYRRNGVFASYRCEKDGQTKLGPEASVSINKGYRKADYMIAKLVLKGVGLKITEEYDEECP